MIRVSRNMVRISFPGFVTVNGMTSDSTIMIILIMYFWRFWFIINAEYVPLVFLHKWPHMTSSQIKVRCHIYFDITCYPLPLNSQYLKSWEVESFDCISNCWFDVLWCLAFCLLENWTIIRLWAMLAVWNLQPFK